MLTYFLSSHMETCTVNVDVHIFFLSLKKQQKITVKVF